MRGAVLVAFTVIVLPFRAAFISEFYRQLDMHHHLWQQLQVIPNFTQSTMDSRVKLPLRHPSHKCKSDDLPCSTSDGMLCWAACLSLSCRLVYSMMPRIALHLTATRLPEGRKQASLGRLAFFCVPSCLQGWSRHVCSGATCLQEATLQGPGW